MAERGMIPMEPWFTAVSGFLGACIGGVLAYRGSIQGAKRQIEEQSKRIEDEKVKKEKLSIKIITTFLLQEIRHNYLLIYNSPKLHPKIIENITIFQYAYSQFDFKFDEYNQIKYDLLEFENEFVSEIISFYTYISIIKTKTDFKQILEADYEGFREAYLKIGKLFLEHKSP